jgi:hypothetical protein
MEWLWQQIVAHWVIIGLTLVSSAIVGWLRARSSRWVNPFLYGLGTLIALLVIVSLIKHITSDPRPVIATPAALETYIKNWAEEYHFSVRNTPDPQSFFKLIIESLPNRPITVEQSKEHHHGHIRMTLNVTFSPEHKQRLASLPKDQLELFFNELRLELIRTNVGYQMNKKSDKVFDYRIELEQSLAIKDITRDEFMTALRRMERGLLLISEKTSHFLATHKGQG